MMISSLFSIFDPNVSVFLQLNWVSSFIVFLMIPYIYWIIPSRFNIVLKLFNEYMFNEMKILLNKNSQVNLIFFLSLMILIVFNNFMGLFSYIFTSSSHLIFSFCYSMIFWVMMMMFGWINYTEHMFAHLVPVGTPKVLMIFMVMIETISNVIRPGTLAIRLTANMIAGHLLLSLIGSTCISLHFFLILFVIIVQIMLFVLEMSVSLIQAYVFCVLNVLYSSEIK